MQIAALLLAVAAAALAVGVLGVRAVVLAARSRALARDQERLEILTLARDQRRELLQIARSLPTALEDPYAATLVRTQKAVQDGLVTLAHIRRAAGLPAAGDLTQRPIRWGVLASPVEAAQRLRHAWGQRRMRRWSQRTADMLEQARLLSARLAGMDEQLRTAVDQRRNEAHSLLREAVNVPYAAAIALVYERLEETAQCLDHAFQLLDGVQPTPFQVVEAYKLNQRCAFQLNEIKAQLSQHEQRQALLRPRLEMAGLSLSRLQQALAEETVRRPAKANAVALDGLMQELGRLETALDAGDYPTVEARLRDFVQEVADFETQLNELLTERNRIAADCEQVDQELAYQTRWLSAVPAARYRMDLSEALARQMRQDLLWLNARQRTESLEELRMPRLLPIEAARRERRAFEERRRAFEALRQRFTADRVTFQQKRAGLLLRRLQACHPVYQERGRAVGFSDALARLHGNWSLVESSPEVVESRFAELLESMAQVQRAYEELDEGYPTAQAAVDQERTERERCLEVLAFTIFDEIPFVRQNGLPDLTARAAQCLQTHAELRRRANLAGENYGGLLDEAEKLRQQAAAIHNDYQRALKEVTILVRELQEDMRGHLQDVERYSQDRLLDFEELLRGRVTPVNQWIAEVDGVPHLSLNRMSAYADRGVALRGQLRGVLERAAQDVDRTQKMQTAAAGALTAARAALLRAEEALPQLPWVSGNTNTDVLSTQRMRLVQEEDHMTQFAEPLARRKPQSAVEELEQIHRRAVQVQREADTIRMNRAQLVSRLNALSQGHLEEQWGRRTAPQRTWWSFLRRDGG